MLSQPYIWSIEPGYPNRHVGLYDRERSPDRFLYFQGEVIIGDYASPVLKFERSSLRELKRFGCLWNNAGLPLVNAQVAETMMNFSGADFQAVHTVVEASDGRSDCYVIVNVTNFSKCIDHEKTDAVFMPPSPTSYLTFNRLVLSTKDMGDRSFTRDESYRTLLIVSSKARSALIQLGMPGFGFYSADEFFPPVQAKSE